MTEESATVRTVEQERLLRIVSDNIAKIPLDELCSFLNEKVRNDVFENVPTIVTLVANVFELCLSESVVKDYGPTGVEIVTSRERHYRIHDPISHVVDIVTYDSDTVIVVLKAHLHYRTPFDTTPDHWWYVYDYQVCVLDFRIDKVYRIAYSEKLPRIFVRGDLLIVRMDCTVYDDPWNIAIYRIHRHQGTLRFQSVYCSTEQDDILDRVYFGESRLTILGPGTGGREEYWTVELDGNPTTSQLDATAEFADLDEQLYISIEGTRPSLLSESIAREKNLPWSTDDIEVADVFDYESNPVGHVPLLTPMREGQIRHHTGAPYRAGSLLVQRCLQDPPERSFLRRTTPTDLVERYDTELYLRSLQLNSTLTLHYNYASLMSRFQVPAPSPVLEEAEDAEDADLSRYRLVFETETITGMKRRVSSVLGHTPFRYVFPFERSHERDEEYRRRSESYYSPRSPDLEKYDLRSRLLVLRPERNERHHMLVTHLTHALGSVNDPLSADLVRLVVDYC